MGKMPLAFPRAFPNILLPPHILYQLIKMIRDGQQTTPTEEEQLHIIECAYCQIAIEIILAITLDAPFCNYDTDLVSKLLMGFKNANHNLHEWEEYIAAYAETIEIHGIGEANKRFPGLVAHLEHCKACEAEVEDMRLALKQAEQVGLIPSFNESQRYR